MISSRKKLSFFLPMLATLVKEPFSDKEWIYERKLDGQRCLVVKKNNAVTLYSRNHIKLNNTYPELVKEFAKQKAKDFILDGEIVALENSQTSFSKLQLRMQRKNPNKSVRVYFYAFDLLYAEGCDLKKAPLIQRKQALKNLLSFTSVLRYVTHVKTKGVEQFKKACKKKWEGIIAKRADASYVSKRSKDWLKFKCEKSEKLLIVGFTDPSGSRVGFGALLVGYLKAGRLYYAGKVGTGYDTALLKALSSKLKKIEVQKLPFANQKKFPKGVHFVSPKYSCEVTFTEWTNDKRLRHPRFIQLVGSRHGKS